MRIKIDYRILAIIFALIVIYFLFFRDYHVFENNELIESGNGVISAENDTNKSGIYLVFSDSISNCSINGRVFFGDVFIGNTSEEKIHLSYRDYQTYLKYSDELSIEGMTDFCFDEDKGIKFIRSWNLSKKDEYFKNKTNLNLYVNLSTLRTPKTYEEMQSFIRPDEALIKLSSVKFGYEERYSDKIHRLANLKINDISDQRLFKQKDYWQTPYETFARDMGDVEDWAVSILSILKAFDKNIDCYDLIWDKHISVICSINQTFFIYDRDEDRAAIPLTNNSAKSLIVSQENKKRFREALGYYISDRDLKMDEKTVHALINEKEIILLKSNEDLVNWAEERV